MLLVFYAKMEQSHLNYIYSMIFVGKKYWLLDRRLEPPVHRDYPKLINETWGHLLRRGIDAAFRWQDERVYFFKDDQYYQYNFETFRVSNFLL